MTYETDVQLLDGQVKLDAWDLCLDSGNSKEHGRRKNDTPYRRALVHDVDDSLTINYANDYPKGVNINGKTHIAGNLGVYGEVTLYNSSLQLEGKHLTFNHESIKLWTTTINPNPGDPNSPFFLPFNYTLEMDLIPEVSKIRKALNIDATTGCVGALTTNFGFYFQDRNKETHRDSQWAWYAYEGRASLWNSDTQTNCLSVDADGTVNAPMGLKAKDIDVYQTILALQKEVADMKATVKKLEQQLAAKPRAR